MSYDLEIKKKNESDRSAFHFDILLCFDINGHLNISPYGKSDDFNFQTTTSFFPCRNISSSPVYGVFVCKLIRYAITCSKCDDFIYSVHHLFYEIVCYYIIEYIAETMLWNLIFLQAKKKGVSFVNLPLHSTLLRPRKDVLICQ